MQWNPNKTTRRFFQHKLCRPEGSGTIYSECLKKKKAFQPRSLCLAKFSFRIEKEIEFPRKAKAKEVYYH